jgi:hypothetical protein
MHAMTSSAEPGRPAPETTAGGVTGLRVVLAEDDVLLREGLASLLERSGRTLERTSRLLAHSSRCGRSALSFVLR